MQSTRERGRRQEFNKSLLLAYGLAALTVVPQDLDESFHYFSALNPLIEDFCVVKKQSSADFEALKSRHVWLGVDSAIVVQAIGYCHLAFE